MTTDNDIERIRKITRIQERDKSTDDQTERNSELLTMRTISSTPGQ